VFEALPRAARLFIWVLGSRLLALGAMVAGSFWPRPHDDLHWVANDGTFYWQQVPWRVLDVWGRWDTSFYVSIANEGYPPSTGGWAYHAAYFPLLPSMMRAVSMLTTLEPYLAGLLIVQVLLVLAVIYLDKLVRLDDTPQFAERVVLVLMCFPGAHFLSCVYPESMALFFGVFAVFNARTGRPVVAGLACMLAVLTRASGGIVCFAVLYELLRQTDGRLRITPKVLVLLLPGVSVAFLLALHQSMYGDPLYFMHVQAGWGRHATFFLEPFLRFTDSLDYHVLALLGVVAVIFGARHRERLGYVVMGAVNVALPLSTGILRGVHRYMASNFPLFIFIARWLDPRPRWRLAWVIVGLGSMMVFAFKWGQGYMPN
jgi:hypothetical protein